MNCDCYWCSEGKQHPRSAAHSEFHPISSRLLVAESLNPADRVQRKACTTCGHIVEGK